MTDTDEITIQPDINKKDMLPFVYMADAHIRSRTWTNNMLLTGDAYKALDILKAQLKPEVCSKRLIIGGDWFDSNRPTSDDMLATARFLQGFKSVYYIRGNHDSITPSYLESLSSIETGNNICFYELTQTPVALPGSDWKVYIAGISWTQSVPQLKQSISDICSSFADDGSVLYLVLHTSFKHLLNIEGMYKLTAEFIKEHIGTKNIRVLVGDIHTRHTLFLNNEHTQYIHSSGSMYPRSFDKTQDSCAVSLISPLSGNITDIPTDVRRYNTIQTDQLQTILDEADALVKRSESHMLKPFLRVLLPDQSDLVLPAGSCPDCIVQILTKQASEHEIKSAAMNSSYTVQQAAIDTLATYTGCEDLEPFLVQLLNSDDPIKLLESWLESWHVVRSIRKE